MKIVNGNLYVPVSAARDRAVKPDWRRPLPVARSVATVERVVALGASNLTRGFQTVVSAARAAWGSRVEVVAALGHGRSYGARSRILARGLPGILESGLWRDLESRPRAPTRGLITDVGNDILYGFSAEQTLGWVEEAIRRLKRLTEDIVLTGLPLASIRPISRGKFLLVRSVLFPSCRLSLPQVLATADGIDTGLAKMAATHALKFVRMNPAWYGFDPIHIRPSLWQSAWQDILGAGEPDSGRSALEALRLYALRPERQWLFGIEQITPQSGVALPSGGRVWLY
jgi:hypothetical protein